MANPEHLKILKQGVEVWNRWRAVNTVRPDLRGADLRRAVLKSAIFWRADLRGADLSRANLTYAVLTEANFEGANLTEVSFRHAGLNRAVLKKANLGRAVLSSASLAGADLTRADFSKAVFGHTNFGFLDLSQTEGLDSCRHRGPSEVGLDTLSRSRGRITETFLRGCGLSDWEILATKLYDPEVRHDKVSDLVNEIARIRGGRPIQFDSCFISYSHDNKSFARCLYNELQARGIRCWLDERDLKPGDRILDVVNDAIRLHDRILLCCSETSLNSWWVKDEIEKALERERREDRDIVIPLNLDGYLLNGWESGQASTIRSRLAADFTGWEHDNANFEEQFEKVVKALQTDDGVRDKTLESKL